MKLRLLYYLAKYTWQEQANYFWNSWSSLISTFFYTFAQFLFIDVLFVNVKTFAGYTRDEMVLLLLFGQLFFYFEWLWSVNNMEGLIEDIKNGALDTLLTKPISSLFYVTFKKISLINRLKDGLPMITLMCLVINWKNINTDFYKVIACLAIFLMGSISWHCFRFLFIIPTFIYGQARQFFLLSGTLGETNDIPFEGVPGKLKYVLSSIIPAVIASQLSVSVMLGKTPVFPAFVTVFIVTVVFVTLKSVAWNFGLKNYTSASS